MRLGIVVPCYNEAPVIEETARRLAALLDGLVASGSVAPESRIHFVDDGSTDATWACIERLARAHPRVSGVRLSRNRGHQNALIAGLFTAEGDALVSIDADLQDDLDVIPRMLEAHASGADIVYGVREDREADPAFKRITATGFYRLMRLMGVNIVHNHADFRLMSRRAVEHLKEFPEVNLFLRGIVPILGFRSDVVRYARAPRLAGRSKYPLRRMVSFALDGITSHSVAPLRVIGVMGFLIFLFSTGMSVWVVGTKVLNDAAVPGWASSVLPVYFLGGIQILCIGVVGEYLGKIYLEVKRRPRYIIESRV